MDESETALDLGEGIIVRIKRYVKSGPGRSARILGFDAFV
jgi:hypothetical protein